MHAHTSTALHMLADASLCASDERHKGLCSSSDKTVKLRDSLHPSCDHTRVQKQSCIEDPFQTPIYSWAIVMGGVSPLSPFLLPPDKLCCLSGARLQCRRNHVVCARGRAPQAGLRCAAVPRRRQLGRGSRARAGAARLGLFTPPQVRRLPKQLGKASRTVCMRAGSYNWALVHSPCCALRSVPHPNYQTALELPRAHPAPGKATAVTVLHHLRMLLARRRAVPQARGAPACALTVSCARHGDRGGAPAARGQQRDW